MSATSRPVLQVVAGGSRYFAQVSGASNEEILSDAWQRLHGTLPPQIAEKLPRGGFLDAALELCDLCLGNRLVAWTIEYTSFGGPYLATLAIDRADSTYKGESNLSAAAAVVVALYKWHENRKHK